MNICHDMGRPAGCQEWIEQLYDAYISFLGQTLPEVSDARAALGVMPGFGGGPKPPPARQGCRSFSANTKVLMADGTTKPIDKVRVGDQVMATDPETGEQGPRKVTHRWVHDDKLTDLVLNDGTVITTTEDHPFWNATDHQWQPADALSPGDRLLGDKGQHTGVIGIRLGPALPAPAYNLTIDDIHTYYVLAGNTPILVHNCPDDTPTYGAGRSSLGDALTKHGRQRLTERGFDDVDIALTRASAKAYEQAHGGGTAYVARVGNRYNVIVVGDRGIVTGMKGLTQREVNNLARNYGWTGYP